MRRTSTFCLFLLMIPSLVGLTSRAANSQAGEGLAIRAIGQGSPTNRWRLPARDAAINDALRNAVEQCLAGLVKSQEMTRNRFALEANADEFVNGYKIVDEVNEGGVMKVTLDVDVDTRKVVDQLVALDFVHSFVHKPRVMVMILEKHRQRALPDQAAETELIRKFVEKDFWVVDQNQVTQIRQNDEAKRAMQGDNEAAAALARQFRADIIIVGEGKSQVAETEGLGGLISCRARLDARAIRADTGRIIAAHGLHAPGLEVTEELASKKSLAQAGAKVADYMIGEILRKWVLSVSQGTSVTLKLTNVTFSQLVRLEKNVKEDIDQVRRFHRRHFDSVGNIAEIEVDLSGDLQQFTGALSLMESDDFELEVMNLTPKTIDVRYTPKANTPEVPQSNPPSTDISNLGESPTTPISPTEEPISPTGLPQINVYALLVGVSEYDHHPNLPNPRVDIEAVRTELEEVYGCETDVLQNPKRKEFLIQLYALADREYRPDDQILVFFSGHGWFDERLKRGYLALRDSKPLSDDPLRESYVSHEDVRTTLERLDCQHVLLIVDSCFSGTLDAAIAMARLTGNPYTPVSATEFIRRKLQYKTRRYITAGGAEYVSDGIPGHHSPFARRLLEGLRSYGGPDRILTYEEILLFIEKVIPQPRTGEMSGNEPGSSFVLVAQPKPNRDGFGELTVNATPPDSQVSVFRLDSSHKGTRAVYVEPTAVGQNRFRVPFGRYRIRVSRSGYQTATREVDIRAAAQTLKIPLSPER